VLRDVHGVEGAVARLDAGEVRGATVHVRGGAARVRAVAGRAVGEEERAPLADRAQPVLVAGSRGIGAFAWW